MSKTEAIKIKYEDRFLIVFLESDVAPSIDEILQNFEVGQKVEIEKVLMSDKEIDELDEFDGW